MFRKERFLADCRSAVADGQQAIRELVTEAVSDPSGIVAELGEPGGAGVEVLYRADDLTVLNFVWAPCMTLMPHNHNMFAVIGIYGGREDNIFWRRAGPRIEAAGARSMGTSEVATLGRDIIHSVANPLGKFTAAIHVYGGDFFSPTEPRSQWDHETLTEQPWDMDDTRAAFRAAEARFRSGAAGDP